MELCAALANMIRRIERAKATKTKETSSILPSPRTWKGRTPAGIDLSRRFTGSERQTSSVLQRDRRPSSREHRSIVLGENHPELKTVQIIDELKIPRTHASTPRTSGSTASGRRAEDPSVARE